MVARAQDVHERVVGHTLSLLDPLGRVERPMDTEADPAPAGFFLRLRQRGEALPVTSRRTFPRLSFVTR